MVILGIDPSLRATGWGVVHVEASSMRSKGFGVIANPAKLSQASCLLRIRDELRAAISTHQPTVVAVEGLIYVQNVKTALILGQARGAAVLAAAEAGLEVFEYAPRRVKQSVVGVGKAGKNQVGFMVRALLGLTETPESDAADALAIAISHANAKKPNLAKLSF
jgi:crossover junction endodeoxyribonuclease RuvC